VIDEGLLLPLYHCFGSAVSSSETENRDMKNRVKTGLAVCAVVYAVFEGSISAAAPGDNQGDQKIGRKFAQFFEN
jgi:hypothetical protein